MERRRMRARVVAYGVAVTGLAGLLGGIVALQPAGEGPHMASVPITTAIDRAPIPEDEARLPRTSSALPERIAVDPGSAAKLSGLPVPGALALFQHIRTDVPIYVLGTDGRMRVIDELQPEPVRDAGGNEMTALSSTSLSPDGTKAALPQADAVIVWDRTDDPGCEVDRMDVERGTRVRNDRPPTTDRSWKHSHAQRQCVGDGLAAG